MRDVSHPVNQISLSLNWLFTIMEVSPGYLHIHVTSNLTDCYEQPISVRPTQPNLIAVFYRKINFKKILRDQISLRRPCAELLLESGHVQVRSRAGRTDFLKLQHQTQSLRFS